MTIKYREISTDFDHERFWSKVGEPNANGCREWQTSRIDKGYGHFKLDGEMALAHRVAYTLIYGPIREGHQVLHQCNNPPCCGVGHHFLGNNDANIQQAQIQGRFTSVGGQRPGEGNPHAKLTDDKVQAVRKAYASGNITRQQLADQYQVSKSAIDGVVDDRSWKHVK